MFKLKETIYCAIWLILYKIFGLMGAPYTIRDGVRMDLLCTYLVWLRDTHLQSRHLRLIKKFIQLKECDIVDQLDKMIIRQAMDKPLGLRLACPCTACYTLRDEYTVTLKDEPIIFKCNTMILLWNRFNGLDNFNLMIRPSNSITYGIGEKYSMYCGDRRIYFKIQ